MKMLSLLALIGLLAGPCLAEAQQPSRSTTTTSTEKAAPDESPELAAIRAGSEAFVAAFNRGDAKALAALWTAEGEYIDDSGRRFAGREAIEKAYAEFFEAHKGLTLKISIDSLRLVSPTTAIEEGQSLVEPSPTGSVGTSRYSVVHVKTDNQWLMASVRDAWVEAPPAVQSAADLQWLIGKWQAEEHGVKMEWVCRWVADGRFIERSYTSTQVDGTKTSGVQLIGWNALNGYVQSWDFSGDGGHAVGVWSPAEGGWRAEVLGAAGDGAPITAVNWLIRLDDNAYVWKSVERYRGDLALPDTDEVVIKRQKDQESAK